MMKSRARAWNTKPLNEQWHSEKDGKVTVKLVKQVGHQRGKKMSLALNHNKKHTLV